MKNALSVTQEIFWVVFPLIIFFATGQLLENDLFSRLLAYLLLTILSFPVLKRYFSFSKIFAIGTIILLIADCYLLIHKDKITSVVLARSYNFLEILEVLIVGPIVEEFYFRGFLYSYFTKHKRNEIFIWIISSLAFGIYHFHFWNFQINIHSIEHVGTSILAGLFFGWLIVKTKSLTWPILFHMTANTFIMFIRLFETI